MITFWSALLFMVFLGIHLLMIIIFIAMLVDKMDVDIGILVFIFVWLLTGAVCLKQTWDAVWYIVTAIIEG